LVEKEIKIMTYREIEKSLKSFMEENYDLLNGKVIAIRYDNVNAEVGTILNDSKSNLDRDDSRDFPGYGSSEYDSMDEIDGTCVYAINSEQDYRNFIYGSDDVADFFEEYGIDGPGIVSKEDSMFNHCSIVTGEENTDCQILREDEGEMVLKNCTVAVKLW